MSVLIRDMEMPKSCADCRLMADGWCYSVGLEQREKVSTVKRPTWCPLVPVPPHGRLIDADEIAEHKYITIPPHRKQYADGKPKSEEETVAFKFGWNYALEAVVQYAPTIIPAEEGE